MFAPRIGVVLILTSFAVLAGCDDDAASPGDSGSPPHSTPDASTDAGVRDASARDAANTPVRDAGPASGTDAGADAGGVDAASANDASTPPPASGCDYALCEDFESAATGALPSGWTVQAGWMNGMPMVSDAEHHGGTHALKAAVASSGQPRASRSLSSLGELAGKHWGRIFYKVKTPAPLPSQGVIHNTIVALKGSVEARVVDTVVNTQGKHNFLYNLPDDSCCSGSSYDYASYDGKWHCAEWYVDASTQTFRFFFEGNEVKSIGFTNMSAQRSHIEKFSAVLLGWINYQTPSTPYEAWLDDLAIDGQQIGCK